MQLRIAPTEPPELRELGEVSSIPERLGADIIIGTGAQLVGIQRKVFPGDFVASLRDGRLQKEVAQMKSLPHAYLLLEGLPVWTTDYEIMTEWGKWNADAMVGFLTTLQSEFRINLYWTDDLRETCLYVKRAAAWWAKDEHTSLKGRPKQTNPWMSPENPDWQAHFLQGLPLCGPKMASNIIDTFHGLPINWTVTEDELKTVPGVGKKTASQLFRYLAGRRDAEKGVA